MRVLLYRLGSVGDTVVALPALHLVARAWPDAERRLLTNVPGAGKAAPAEAVLGGSGLVTGYFAYPAGVRNPLVLVALWWRLLWWRADVLVYLAAPRGVRAARRDAWFFRACGIRRLVGVPVRDDMQANQPVGGGLVEAEWARLARCVRELGLADCWDLRLTAAERARGEALAGEWVVCSVGTKMQANDWGVERWRELLGRVSEAYPGVGLVMTGVTDEREASDIAAGLWCGPMVNVCGELSVRETAGVIARGRIFLGHDSGALHLAEAVGVPVVGVYSARNLPGRWFPHGARNRVVYHAVDCRGCRLETCLVERKKCIESIAVEEVLAEMRVVLGGDGQGSV